MGLFAGTKWDIPPTCNRCGKEEELCECPPEEIAAETRVPENPPEKQNLRIKKEKRKKGKVVTTISGFKFVHPESGHDLLKQLKNLCGTGGKFENDLIELQGDLVERLAKELAGRGFKVKAV